MNPDRQIQIAGHGSDDKQLLEVLLTKEGNVGRNDLEQLQDDRGHPSK